MLTSKDDLSLSTVKILIDNPLDFDPKDVPEPYTQYVRHFIYMVKRNERKGNDPLGYGEDADGSLSSPKKRAVKKRAIPTLHESSADTAEPAKKKTSPKKKAPKKKISK
jgi:hypothetical protein